MTAKEEDAAKAVLLGNWICIAATVWLIIGLVCFIGCGCEDDSDTVYEAQDIVVGSNSQVIVVSDNSGIVSVDQQTGEGNDDPSIYVTGNTGRVYVVSRPTIPEPEEPTE